MTGRTKPFAGFEFLIAWRYLRARRATGGVSVMTWISFLGIALAVAALIATLSVRSGFRHEFVGIILGANPHLEVLATPQVNEAGQIVRELSNYDAIAADLRGLDGIEQAAPVVQGQVMASGNGRNAGVQVTGIGAEDLARIPLIAEPEMAWGDIGRFDEGVAVGSRIARALGLQVGDPIRLISPEGARTPFGVSPRVGSFEVTYIFQVGRYDIDATRIYMPLAEAQTYFNRDGVVDAVEVTVADPERVNALALPVLSAVEDRVIIETWQDSSGAYLQALTMEDNVMFIILSILVLIAALNIVSGLIMLVKNKSRDIGILRTMGLSEGSILRVFFICGASVGLAGTAVGVALGCAFAIWIDPIFEFVNFLAGGGVWDPSIRFLSALPARLEWGDVGSAMALSLGLSFLVTIFPARRAARMNPVEALRYE
ncbi:MAG: lipoprotein-releasing ABC transporter permease subunit [Pseudomonadota bacterium]